MYNPFELIEARLNNIEALLLDLKHAPQNEVSGESESSVLLTVTDAAEFLHLSVPTIYGLISKGEIPVMKRSKRCYFTKADLLDYLKHGRKSSVLETGKKANDYITPKGK